MKHAIVIAAALMLGACGQPRVVDTSGCAWTKTIYVDADAYAVIQVNKRAMRDLTDQINDHNDARDRNCGKDHR